MCVHWLKPGTAMYQCIHDLTSIFVQCYTYNVQKIETYITGIALCMRNLHNFIQKMIKFQVICMVQLADSVSKEKENYVNVHT